MRRMRNRNDLPGPDASTSSPTISPQLSFDHRERQPAILKAHRDRFSSDATTETHDVKFLRQVRTSVTICDGRALQRVLARRAVVYQTLVSVSAQAAWDHEVELKSTRRCRRHLRLIDPTPAHLVSCVRGKQHEATRTTDPPR